MPSLIQNREAIRALLDGAGLTINDAVPMLMGDAIYPSLDVTPDFHRIGHSASQTKTTTGTSSLSLTTSPLVVPVSGAVFYLTDAVISFVKNATCDQATGSLSLSVQVDGQYVTIAGVAVLTLTAERGDCTFHFEKPIKCDLNDVVLTGTFTAGAMSRTHTISGYWVA